MRSIALLFVVAILACTAAVPAPDAANATYQIEKSAVTLANGRAEAPTAPGSAAKAVTTLNAKAAGDLDGDGREDVAVILISEPGGSGTFSYAAVLLDPTTGAKATNAVLIGDRMGALTIQLDGKIVVVSYLDHRAGEALSTAPSVPTTKRFVIRDGTLVPA